MPFDAPQISIGTGPFMVAEVVLPAATPALDGPDRPLLPGTARYVYARVSVSLDGGTAQTQICRVLLSHLLTQTGATEIAAGQHPVRVRVTSPTETDIVPAGTLRVGPTDVPLTPEALWVTP